MDEVREKHLQEITLREELEAIRHNLEPERKNLLEVTLDREKLKTLCDEKETAIQVSYNITLSSFFCLVGVVYLFILSTVVLDV